MAQWGQPLRILRARKSGGPDHCDQPGRGRLREDRIQRQPALHHLRDGLRQPARPEGGQAARDRDQAMNVKVGDSLPEQVKHPTTRQLVQYAGAQGDFYEIHYDQAFAQSVGLPGVILHGLLKAGFLGQLVTDWLGDRGTLKSFEVSYRGTDQPGRPYLCRGQVKNVEGDQGELEGWGERSAGNRTTVGTATVESKG